MASGRCPAAVYRWVGERAERVFTGVDKTSDSAQHEQLTELEVMAREFAVAGPSAWPIGKKTDLTDHVRLVLARAPGDLKVAWRSWRVAWLLATGGAGASVAIDGPARLYLPTWLRQTDSSAELLVGTARMTASC